MLRLLFLHTPTKLNRCINVFKLSFTEDASIHIRISYHIETPSYNYTRIWKVITYICWISCSIVWTRKSFSDLELYPNILTVIILWLPVLITWWKKNTCFITDRMENRSWKCCFEEATPAVFRDYGINCGHSQPIIHLLNGCVYLEFTWRAPAGFSALL